MSEIQVASLDRVIELFGAEPETLDDSPWPYTDATFRTSRGGFDVNFVYCYSHQRITISRDGREMASVELDRVSALEVEIERDRELLMLRPMDTSRSITLRLHPDVYLGVTG